VLFDYFRFSRFAFDWIFLEDSPGVRATVLSPCAPACIEKKEEEEMCLRWLSTIDDFCSEFSFFALADKLKGGLELLAGGALQAATAPAH